jgi:hypothetical protein
MNTLDAIRTRDMAFHTHGTPGLNAPRDRAALLDAIDAVTALHQPVDALMYAGKSQAHKVQVCTGCGQDDGNWNRYPCPTVRAINKAMEAAA